MSLLLVECCFYHDSVDFFDCYILHHYYQANSLLKYSKFSRLFFDLSYSSMGMVILRFSSTQFFPHTFAFRNIFQFRFIFPFLTGEVVCLGLFYLQRKREEYVCCFRTGTIGICQFCRLLSTPQYNSLSERCGHSFSYTIIKRLEHLMLCASVSTDVAASGQRNLYRSSLLLVTPLLPVLPS